MTMSLPDLTCGSAVSTLVTPASTCPPMMSTMSGEPPLYGTGTTLMPAFCLMSSPVSCVAPSEYPTLMSACRPIRIKASRSGNLPSFCTTSTMGDAASSVIGVKSFTES